ncbi:hypothetical protein L6164_016660 [Bauhinia variegata]|uniref:Uncharacterized protein n=1 Tax=Bauhinia variegata TaxID=167791 RepID=A0ACB9NPA9_BAUVA|nr:hypothetical protein L6164_016660 [Bauhinia variegata]
MVPELQKPRITEIQVRMDCNGCVQKIKKTLNGINGIYDMYIDFPQQKITIIGWADPERIVKAIKKTRKIATICSHVEATESPPQTTEQAPPEGNAPAPDATQQPPAETPPDQVGPPVEPPKDTPPPEQPPPEATPQPPPTENNASHQSQSNPGTKDVEEVNVICRHPPNYGGRYGSGHSYDGRWYRYNNSPVFIQEPPRPHNNNPVFIQEPPRPYNNSPVFIQEPPRPYNNNPVLIQQPPPPMYVTHSYNTYRTSPYVTEYEYVRSPPRHTYYNRMEHYSGDYQYQNSNGNITSIFSDENPNACRIV